MEPSPFQQFRDIIERNYSPKEERELDDKADELFEDLDYQNSKRYYRHESDPDIPYDFESDQDWDFRDPPEWSL
jgi:hypothetical protein